MAEREPEQALVLEEESGSEREGQQEWVQVSEPGESLALARAAAQEQASESVLASQ